MLNSQYPRAHEAVHTSYIRETDVIRCSRAYSTMLTFLLAVLFGAASLPTTGESQLLIGKSLARMRYLTIASSLFLLTLIGLLFGVKTKVYKIPRRSLVTLLLWFGFAIVSNVSAFAHKSGLGVSLWYLLGVPSLFFFTLPRVFRSEVDRAVSVALIAGQLPYVIISILRFPVAYPFKGVFPNANSMGVACTSIACGLFGLLLGAAQRENTSWKIVFYTVFLGVCFALVLLSGSRTSLVAFLTMLAAVLCSPSLRIKARRVDMFAKIVVGLLIFASLGSLFAGTFLADTMEGIVVKASEKRAKGVLLSGRSHIWKQTLDDGALLGHGASYFANTFGLGGHNNIIGVIGVYGLLAGILLVGFAFAAGYGAYKAASAASCECPFRASTLITMIGFWVLGMGENLFSAIGLGITVAYYLSVGSTLRASGMHFERDSTRK